jgi:hypothetical protein
VRLDVCCLVVLATLSTARADGPDKQAEDLAARLKKCADMLAKGPVEGKALVEALGMAGQQRTNGSYWELGDRRFEALVELDRAGRVVELEVHSRALMVPWGLIKPWVPSWRQVVPPGEYIILEAQLPGADARQQPLLVEVYLLLSASSLKGPVASLTMHRATPKQRR